MFNDVIAAISTNNITASAISIVRMSGEDCFDVLNKIFVTKDCNYQGYHIYYGHIVDPKDHRVIDEVLVNIFVAPKSFTGENMVEINCHGSLYITSQVLTLCFAYGARQAINGEFTKRAFLNGRIDLTQAEAVNDLIMSNNKDNAKLALNSLNGSISKLLNPLINDLEAVIAHIEVNIDYPEYDDNGIITASEIKPLLDDWLNKCDEILNVANSSLVIKEGVNTVIVGKPNVGKSSLLNALLHQDKAIVSDIAGTTRDLVEGDIHLNNVTLHLIDTAGIRQSDNAIEKIGIEKSLQALANAQLVIVVLDSSNIDEYDKQLLEQTKDYNRIIVNNKSDLKQIDGINICALKDDIAQLVDKINEMFAQHQIALSQPALTNERQIALMRQAKEAILNAKQQLQDDIPLDLIDEDITIAYSAMKEILGKNAKEDLLDGIFSRFCVGK